MAVGEIADYGRHRVLPPERAELSIWPVPCLSDDMGCGQVRAWSSVTHEGGLIVVRGRPAFSAVGGGGEQGHEQVRVRAAPTGGGVPARPCPIARDRSVGELGGVFGSGGDVVEGLVVVKAMRDLVDRRVDEP